MEVIFNLLSQSGIEQNSVLLLVFLLAFIPAFPFLRRRVVAGKSPGLRPIPGFEALRRMTSQSMETGRRLHVSVGTQGIEGQNTAQTLAGLTTLEYLARESAVYGAPPIVSVADPTAMIVAQDVLSRSFADQRQGERFDPCAVRMIAPDPTTYASGAMGILSREDVLANVMTGVFGDEYLLIGEAGDRKDIQQIVGTGNPQALPFMMVTADHVLMGEEIFASGAYLAKLPSHVASLLVQDWMRIVVILIIIVGVVLSTIS